MTSKWLAVLAPIGDESDRWLFTKMRVQEDGYPDIAEQWTFHSLTTAAEIRRALRAFGIGVVDLSESKAAD